MNHTEFEALRDLKGKVIRDDVRSHKHALRSERCAERNLPDAVIDRPDVSGRSVRELFDIFCTMGQITHEGTLEAPDESP